MFKRILKFIKYNNAMVLILAVLILGGTGAFAQTETGQAMIGGIQTNIKGIDNTLLLEAELDDFNADYKIERVREDAKYYYVTYTFLDIVRLNSAWQYQIQENVRKVSKKLKKDLGVYIAEELAEQHQARIKDLKLEKEKAEKTTGEETRIEVTEYSGLIGQTLILGGKIFPNYDPVKIREIPSPSIPPAVLLARTTAETTPNAADSLTDVYNDYIERMDPDGDEVFGIIDNCPAIANPLQIDSDDDGLGDLCDPEPLTPSTAAVAGTIDPEPEEDIATSTDISEEGTDTSTEETIVEELIDEIINSDENIDPAENLPSAPEENTEEPPEDPDVIIVDIENLPEAPPLPEEPGPEDSNIEITEE